MHVLEGVDLQGFRLQGGDRLHGGASPGQGGHRRHGVIKRGLTQVGVVVLGLATDRGVDDQLDSAGSDRVLDVGATFMNLQHRLDAQTLTAEQLGRATGGDQGKAQFAQAAGHRHQGGLVAVVGGDEDVARGRQGIACGLLGLGVGHAEAPGTAHHLAGAAHLGSQQGV